MLAVIGFLVRHTIGWNTVLAVSGLLLTYLLQRLALYTKDSRGKGSSLRQQAYTKLADVRQVLRNVDDVCVSLQYLVGPPKRRNKLARIFRRP
jgi:hypothetical protein